MTCPVQTHMQHMVFFYCLQKTFDGIELRSLENLATKFNHNGNCSDNCAKTQSQTIKHHQLSRQFMLHTNAQHIALARACDVDQPTHLRSLLINAFRNSSKHTSCVIRSSKGAEVAETHVPKTAGQRSNKRV